MSAGNAAARPRTAPLRLRLYPWREPRQPERSDPTALALRPGAGAGARAIAKDDALPATKTGFGRGAGAAASTGPAGRVINGRAASDPPGKLRGSSAARNIPLFTFLAFCSCGFLLGGGSRPDIASLVVLRPLAFLALAAALVMMRRDEWRHLGMPGLLLGALAAIMALQLLPLPPEWWHSLPGRSPVIAVDALVGLPDLWRPLSLSPSRTLNALLSLAVPAAGLCLAASLPPRRHAAIVWFLLAAGGCSALLGLMQIMGPPDGPLYPYRITNEGVAVGLFANRNHHAIFLAGLIPLIGWASLAGAHDADADRRMLALGAGIAACLLLVAVTVVTGSRAGTLLAVANAGLFACFLAAGQRRLKLGREHNRIALAALLPGVLVLAGVAAMFALTYSASRSLAVERLFANDLSADLRLATLPTLRELVAAYFPAGSGFGSFYLVYQAVEPIELLGPQYLNQAHNDVLQLLIEGGIVGALILLAGLAWLARAGWRAWRGFLPSARSGSANHPPVAPFAWLSLATLLAGSVFDYPLRTPSLALAAALLAWLIWNCKAEQTSPDSEQSFRKDNS